MDKYIGILLEDISNHNLLLEQYKKSEEWVNVAAQSEFIKGLQRALFLAVKQNTEEETE